MKCDSEPHSLLLNVLAWWCLWVKWLLKGICVVNRWPIHLLSPLGTTTTTLRKSFTIWIKWSKTWSSYQVVQFFFPIPPLLVHHVADSRQCVVFVCSSAHLDGLWHGGSAYQPRAGGLYAFTAGGSREMQICCLGRTGARDGFQFVTSSYNTFNTQFWCKTSPTCYTRVEVKVSLGSSALLLFFLPFVWRCSARFFCSQAVVYVINLRSFCSSFCFVNLMGWIVSSFPSVEPALCDNKLKMN